MGFGLLQLDKHKKGFQPFARYLSLRGSIHSALAKRVRRFYPFDDLQLTMAPQLSQVQRHTITGLREIGHTITQIGQQREYR